MKPPIPISIPFPFALALFVSCACLAANAFAASPETVRLADVRLRDCCVLADAKTQTYYLVSSTGRRGPDKRPAVVQYTSKDLVNWTGPRVVFEIPEGFWAQKGIWAPELHAYHGKYYLFLTFDTDTALCEQWRDWLPRVKRGSQVLVADSPEGPFRAFGGRPDQSTLPPDMMTLDGTLWVEDGVPHMVFCHEWVQIKDGTVECVRLTEDLSATVGEPVRLFNGSDAAWSKKSATYGCHVTDGPWLHRTASGKLLMLWSTGGAKGYTTGYAVSDSGKLAGPWRQEPSPLFGDDGGHAMMFRRFGDGKLMMILHTPNKTRLERAVIFEIEEEGDSLRVGRRIG
ncbi:MAG: glycoside hydrolase family 43 protein [Opitutaceae bacterium]|nr:glycoside hydrolase family 43 protein [Opitutaceae bacterium]